MLISSNCENLWPLCLICRSGIPHCPRLKIAGLQIYIRFNFIGLAIYIETVPLLEEVHLPSPTKSVQMFENSGFDANIRLYACPYYLAIGFNFAYSEANRRPFL